MKKTLLLSLMCCLFLTSHAQQCNVQGVIQYFYNDYFGFRPDIGAEVLFIKYSSTKKIPKRETWETYQGLIDKLIKYEKARHYFDEATSEELSGFKKEYGDSIQTLSAKLWLETTEYEDNNMVKYSTIVDASGRYNISIPFGTWYVLIKSKNRKLPTILENENRYQMIRVVLNNPTKIISYDFDIPH